MRKVRYAVAASLDGYIAGPNGEADWIITDPEIDFQALFTQFDTLLMGRRTFEAAARTGGPAMPGMTTFVFSQTLRQSDYPDVTIVSDAPRIRQSLPSAPSPEKISGSSEAEPCSAALPPPDWSTRWKSQ